MSDYPKISLAELKGSIPAEAEPEKVKAPAVKTKRLQRVISARLVANEYLRNGLDLKQAYEDVTHKKYSPARFNAMLSEDTAFLDEVNIALTSADLEKNKIVGMLWAMACVSPLDFMDDEGVTLSVKDLKALPREMQAMLEAVDVTNEQVPVKDQDGQVMTDESGRPYLRVVQKVQVRIVKSKKEALSTLAQIGKFIGPTMLNQTNVTVYNVAQSISDADNRRMKLLESRLGGVIEVKPDGSVES